ncbi:hypothetical protein ZWY2020_018797 [Hordeum vulgare]|nr:hypothetical protein ZWY2020_018797 [Hordeum vulgare]
MFLCLVARVVWRTVGSILRTECGPNYTWQYYVWINAFLPVCNDVYTVGLDAICWAMWLARNHATFEKKWINNPFEIVFTACAFIQYWAGLQKPEMGEVIKKGAEMLKENASQMLLLCGPPMPESSKQGKEGDKWDEW